MEETDALEATDASRIFDSAPKIPNISSDHFWVCDSHSSRRHRVSPCPVEFDFHDLDLVDAFMKDSMEMLEAADPLPTGDPPPILVEDPILPAVEHLRSEEPVAQRAKRNIHPPERFMNQTFR